MLSTTVLVNFQERTAAKKPLCTSEFVQAQDVGMFPVDMWATLERENSVR